MLEQEGFSHPTYTGRRKGLDWAQVEHERGNMSDSCFPSYAIEGDFIETVDSLIFDVKGFIHPPYRVIAYLRYVPDRGGERQRHGQKFRKIYNLDERRSFLSKFCADCLYFDLVFNREMQGVPRSKILRHYDPRHKVQQMIQSSMPDRLETRSLEFLDLLKSATGLPTADFGISGSILVGLHTHASDIDLVVYGGRSGPEVVKALRTFQNENASIRRYRPEELWRLRESRLMFKSMNFQAFVWHERRKSLQGFFHGSEYFVRCVRKRDESSERYGDKRYFPLGRMTIDAVVLDDSEGIFTPSRYLINNVKIVKGFKSILPLQIVSFRGRFCEQAKSGERILARGRLEKVVSSTEQFCQLVVGEDQDDQFIVEGH